MKNLILQITVLIVISLAFSCSDDFLKDEWEYVLPKNASIVISPNWDAEDYPIFCPNVENAKFTITNVPSWLKISSLTGQFSYSCATLNCKAIVHDEFSEVGIYYSYMTLAVEGKGNQTILVAYITEGNPVVEMENQLHYEYYSHEDAIFWLRVKNTGKGILFGSIVSYPEWLSFTNKDETVISLPQNGKHDFRLLFKKTYPISGNLSGKIVMMTNDKNREIIEVDVRLNLGNPTVLFPEQVDFGKMETIREVTLGNLGYGLLLWKIKDLPNWLTVSESNGILEYFKYKQIKFNCKRELLLPGINTATIYLESNDKDNPSYPITVTAIKD